VFRKSLTEERHAENAARSRRWRANNLKRSEGIRKASYERNRVQNLGNSREKSRQWRVDHPKETREAWATWYKLHPEKALIIRIKGKAKRNGIAFDLLPSDIDFPKVCPVLGIPMNYEDTRSDGYPHLDRIVPSVGYVSGNVCIISSRANRIKQDGTAYEHLLIADYIKAHTEEKKAA
jgi:hypothetical protein